MFVMLYNNFVNPTHLIYCYQRLFFEDLALNQICLYTAFIYLFMCVFILGRRKVKMLRCWINDRLQNSRFLPFFSKLFSLSADWWRKILMQSRRASSFSFQTWLPYDERKNLFDKRKNPAVLQSR